MPRLPRHVELNEGEPGDRERTAPMPDDGIRYSGVCKECGKEASRSEPNKFGRCLTCAAEYHTRWWIRVVWADTEQQRQRCIRRYGIPPPDFSRADFDRLARIFLPYMLHDDPELREAAGKALANAAGYYRYCNADKGERRV
jgi:hypothetical protein